MNEQLGAVIVIYFQYEYFRVVDIDIKIYKLQIKMINQMSSISSFLLLSLKSEDSISKFLPIMNIYKWTTFWCDDYSSV